MFTGIVEDTGVVSFVRPGGDTVIGIRPLSAGSELFKPGDSVSVSGICLTVVSTEDGGFTTQMSSETVSRTTMADVAEGKVVNLERSVTPEGLMGGHIVTGHIDGVGRVESTGKRGDSVEFRFSLPGGFMKYVAPKGCIAIDGVSLTVNEATGVDFSVNVIPYTLSHTTFASLSAGDGVNFECDIIAKYVERLGDFGVKKS